MLAGTDIEEKAFHGLQLMSCELLPGSGCIHDISHGTKRGNTRQVTQTPYRTMPHQTRPLFTGAH